VATGHNVVVRVLYGPAASAAVGMGGMAQGVDIYGKRIKVERDVLC
jgi:hypothetical protein